MHVVSKEEIFSLLSAFATLQSAHSIGSLVSDWPSDERRSALRVESRKVVPSTTGYKYGTPTFQAVRATIQAVRNREGALGKDVLFAVASGSMCFSVGQLGGVLVEHRCKHH